MVIAIDGGAATGKTTLAKLLSKKIGFVHLNSGLIYRAVTYISLKQDCINMSSKRYDDFLNSINMKILGCNLDTVIYNNVDITNKLYDKNITDNIKYVSNNPCMRKFITGIQRDLSKNINVVCEGRDIGSVVFPKAEIKFYLECHIEERTNRRFKQFADNNIEVDKKDLKKLIIERDENDISRIHSPLKKMKDSIVIDTTYLKVDEVIIKMSKNIKDKYVN